MHKCVDIKHTLSTESKASLDVSEINFEIDEFLRITRHKFEQMCAPLLNRIQDILIQTFSKTNIFACDINKVLLVGGGCQMPMISQFLRKRFPKADHTCDENPDEMVAIGAAYKHLSFLMSKNDECFLLRKRLNQYLKMVFHVGIEADSGNIAAYNDITKETIMFETEEGNVFLNRR
uniref:Hypoxia up-regulated protein 1 n=1 Tax=Panagrolaimus davidi TaxID=227884 RepID=A0A914Q111_9BILA